MIDRVKSGARLPSSCAHVQMERHPEFHLDCAHVGRASEDRECGFSKGQWLIARDKECDNAQRCANVDKLVNGSRANVEGLMIVESDQEAKFDQETSIADVKNTLTGELRSVGWVEQRVKRVADECEYCERFD